MYIGIDLGTSAVKLLLINKDGKVIKSVSEEYPLILVKDGWIEQDPNQWFEQTYVGLKKIVLGYEKEIRAISFSGQMHGSVFLDKESNVIRPAILWCDQRTAEECNEINSYFGKKIIELTGNKALTGFTAPKILWLKKNEKENFDKLNMVMLPKDYLSFKFSGNYSTDVSDASGMLLLDVKNKSWSKEVLEYIGINQEQLPKLYESYEVVGYLNKTMTSELGLEDNIKIVAGGGDQAVGAVGAGVVNDGILSISLGTSGVVFVNSSHYLADKSAKLHSFCHANGGYHQMGVMLNAGGALKWWMKDINKSEDYETYVEDEAKNASIENGVFFLPYLTGERTPHNDPDVRGSFIGLSHNTERGDMTRSVLEGITYALRDSYEIMKEQGIEGKKVRVNGGGAKSIFWKQMISDIFNLEVEVVNSTDGPAFGAAILAAVGDGCYQNVNIACEKIVKVEESYKPNLEANKVYNEKYEKFKTIYPLIKKL